MPPGNSGSDSSAMSAGTSEVPTAAAISFAAMRYVGNSHIDDCVHVVDALLGPRQVGKTTLARKIAASVPNALYLDLERPADLARPGRHIRNMPPDRITG